MYRDELETDYFNNDYILVFIYIYNVRISVSRRFNSVTEKA